MKNQIATLVLAAGPLFTTAVHAEELVYSRVRILEITTEDNKDRTILVRTSNPSFAIMYTALARERESLATSTRKILSGSLQNCHIRVGQNRDDMLEVMIEAAGSGMNGWAAFGEAMLDAPYYNCGKSAIPQLEDSK